MNSRGGIGDMAGANPKTADLPIRAVTALVMIVVAGVALWLGGLAWMVFVLVIGIGVWFEWSALCLQMYPPSAKRTAWRYAGAVYCGIACAVLLAMRDMPDGTWLVLLVVGAVIGTDVGAYALGRALGGPKIAPKISPSKTWAGLFGGILGASLVSGFVAGSLEGFAATSVPDLLLAGTFIAVVAQAGDFFESWMKRKAGVKDSGKLLPGHGGLFDRVDGLMAVLFVIGIVLGGISIGALLMGQPLLPTPA